MAPAARPSETMIRRTDIQRYRHLRDRDGPRLRDRRAVSIEAALLSVDLRRDARQTPTPQATAAPSITPAELEARATGTPGVHPLPA